MSAWLVVLAGGSGTRFWPRSRAHRPKQLLKIVGDQSLLSLTLERFQGWIPEQRCLVVTTRALSEAVKEELAANLPGVQILAEPEGRNTAPCIAMAMEWIRAKDVDAEVVVVPADHWIPEREEYLKTMRLAADHAATHPVLCTVGIRPTRPETGFGYIRISRPVAEDVFSVDRFVEKPSKEVAETMVQSPEYLWNAGMFVWRAQTFFRELEEHCRELVNAFRPYRIALESRQANVDSTLEQCYRNAPVISIDYALMEKSRHVAVVPGANFDWNDLGSFLALEEVYPKCEGGVARADQVLSVDSVHNVIDCPGKTVALLGVTDMIVVDAGDVILVASKERAQDVKVFVDRLKKSGQPKLV